MWTICGDVEVSTKTFNELISDEHYETHYSTCYIFLKLLKHDFIHSCCYNVICSTTWLRSRRFLLLNIWKTRKSAWCVNNFLWLLVNYNCLFRIQSKKNSLTLNDPAVLIWLLLPGERYMFLHICDRNTVTCTLLIGKWNIKKIVLIKFQSACIIFLQYF